MIWYTWRWHLHTLIFWPPYNPMGSFWNPHISKCSMMPKWHHPDINSGDVRESRTKRKLKVYATSRSKAILLLCGLDYRPHYSQTCQNCSFSTKMAIFDKNATMGPTDHIQNVFNRLDISFWVIWNIFWPWQYRNSDFQFFAFSIGYTGVLRGTNADGGVWRPTWNFFKGHICSSGVKWNTFWPWPIWNKNLPYLWPALIYIVLWYNFNVIVQQWKICRWMSCPTAQNRFHPKKLT